MASLLLTACAGDAMLSLFGPKLPEVPEAPAGEFPSFNAPTVARPPVLDTQGQAKMETDLEALAKQTHQKGEEAAKDVP